MKKTSFKLISESYGVGSNSNRVLIENDGKKRILKFTDYQEIFVPSIYTPKLFSINNPKFSILNKNDAEYVYEYEFIEGQLLSECEIDDCLLYKVVKMLHFFFSNYLFVWDCHIENILVSNGNPYFVDFGGIDKMPFTDKHYIFDFLPPDCPEEFLADNYPESYNTETFTIYWIADQILKKCNCNLSNFMINVLNKMHSKTIKNRYYTFAQIVSKLDASNYKI